MADTATTVTRLVIIVSLLLAYQGGLYAEIGVDLMLILGFFHAISYITTMWTSLGQEAPMNPVLSPQQASWRHVLLPEESLLFDRERLEQENRDSSVYGDDLGHEQIVDHDGDTEPLLREWFAERERELLSGTYEDSLDDDDDSGYDDESLLSGTTLVDGDWPSSDDSGYESAGSSDDGHVNSFGSDPSGD